MDMAVKEAALAAFSPVRARPHLTARAVFERVRDLANRPDISPLRYPGGKRKLALLVAYILSSASRPIRLLVEPFAGGAAVSLALLESGLVENIALADSDALVASFWKTVFSRQANQLAAMIEQARVSVRERDRVVSSRPRSDLGRAFKCCYLNRTSFSGILNERAGPLGGRHQSGAYKIGCRFNQERIANRIRQLSKLRHRVRFVSCDGYADTIRHVRSLLRGGMYEADIFWYLDPPFFEKAARLYRHVFDMSGHLAFREALNELPGSFVLSYDCVTAAEAIYADDGRAMSVPLGRTSVSMTYAAAERDLRLAKELIVSDLLVDARTKIAVHNRVRAINMNKIRKRS